MKYILKTIHNAARRHMAFVRHLKVKRHEIHENNRYLYFHDSFSFVSFAFYLISLFKTKLKKRSRRLFENNDMRVYCMHIKENFTLLHGAQTDVLLKVCDGRAFTFVNKLHL